MSSWQLREIELACLTRTWVGAGIVIPATACMVCISTLVPLLGILLPIMLPSNVPWRQQKMVQILWFLLLMWETMMEFPALGFAWPSPGCCNQMCNQSVDGERKAILEFQSQCLLCSVLHSIKYICFFRRCHQLESSEQFCFCQLKLSPH